MANKILLIDKDKNHSKALKLYLERRQLHVLIADTNDDLMRLFDGLKPNIIIVDPGLPDTKVIHLLKEIKQSHPCTQIIITAVAEDIDLLMEEFHFDAASYLVKPIKSFALDLALKQARDWIAMNSKLDDYAQELEDLHNAQNLYHQLFDLVPCYISVQDRNLRLTATNQWFKMDFGGGIGVHCYEVYKHRTSPCEKCVVLATFDDGLSHQTEEVVTSKSGKQYNVLTCTAPIKDSTGQIAQVMEMATNITQIRQLQDQLTSLGLMIGSMSHGVKGMLTALDGGIYQLETGLAKQDRERTSRAFDQVKEMADRIRKMVLEILYYAKSRELQYKTLDIDRLAQQVVEAVKPIADKNGIRFETEISPSLGSIELDPNWIQAALVNFIENAVDACSSDRSKSDHYVKFKVFDMEPDQIRFIIQDNGMGMDRETQNKMFSLFFTSKGSQGTGLGLFIANLVIQQHNGNIQVESKPQEGSLITVCLPRRRPELRRTIQIPKKEQNNAE